jgi:hypothetical protein
MFLTFCQTHYHSVPSELPSRAAHYGREREREREREHITQGVKNLKIPDVETFEKATTRGRNHYFAISSAHNAKAGRIFFPRALPRSHSSLSRLAASAHSHMHGVITLARSSDDNDELLNEQRAREPVLPLFVAFSRARRQPLKNTMRAVAACTESSSHHYYRAPLIALQM